MSGKTLDFSQGRMSIGLGGGWIIMPNFIEAEVSQPKGSYVPDKDMPLFVPPPEGMPDQQMQQQQADEYFGRSNDLRVIQEYNNEELLPNNIKGKFWGLLSKSIKLGFWDKEDAADLFFHKNIIKVGHIMSLPKHKYTFENRQEMNMVDLLVYADFKRGIGMERYRINERTLQATSVTQSIQGGGGQSAKKGGMLAGFRSFFS